MDTHAMDGAIISQLTSAAIVVYLLQWLKKQDWYAKCVTAIPIDDPTVHRLVSALGAFLSAEGVHFAFTGSASAGWHLSATIPPAAVLLHAFWDWAQQFALNQLTYDAVAQRAGGPKAGVLLTAEPAIVVPSPVPGPTTATSRPGAPV